MRKQHKPLFLIRLQQWWSALYVNRILAPQFDSLGEAPFILKPRTVKISGKNIHAGKHLHIISESFKPVNISTWSSRQHSGKIKIGDHCLISPGVNIASAIDISIGHNCMIATEVQINDCDWHGIYNRTRPFRCSSPIVLKDNVWIGMRAIIGKGITIGENSIVAAGAVVVEDVPPNTIVGGNPAKPIKDINPNRRMLTREFLFSNEAYDYYDKNQKLLDEYLFGNNTFFRWIKTHIAPTKRD